MSASFDVSMHTRTELTAHLANLPPEISDPVEYSNKKWSEYGDSQTALRILKTLLWLIELATRGEKGSTSQFIKLIRQSFIGTQSQILNHIATLCRENKWPIYTALVLNGENKLSPTAIRKLRDLWEPGDDMDFFSDEGFENFLQAACFDQVPPKFLELTSAVTLYCMKRKIPLI